MNNKENPKSDATILKSNTDLTPMEPVRLFDNFYFVGTNSVGAFVIDTTEGLIMIDTGWGEIDCPLFVNDMKRLGLNPHNIKMILISHEHVDHFGGVPYLKRYVCPDAKVAMGTIAWNYLQARPVDKYFINSRPQSIDMFLTDGQKIKLGDMVVQVVYTPGHSPGCVSFIVPVTDNGVPHMIGIMGGMTLSNPNWEKVYLYKSSVEYFQKFTRAAKCDVGLAAHPWGCAGDLETVRFRKLGDPHPLVIGTAKFESAYLQQFIDNFQNTIKQMPPEKMPPPPPWIK